MVSSCQRVVVQHGPTISPRVGVKKPAAKAVGFFDRNIPTTD